MMLADAKKDQLVDVYGLSDYDADIAEYNIQLGFTSRLDWRK